jgi:hypothetical protein
MSRYKILGEREPITLPRMTIQADKEKSMYFLPLKEIHKSF